MMEWAKMAERHEVVTDIKEDKWNRGCRGRDNVAVDVMRFSDASSGAAQRPLLDLCSADADYDDNLSGRDYTRRIQ